MVDTMSSFGAIPTPVGEGGVDLVISSANKCVQAMAGLAFVVARRSVIGSQPRPRSLYLDLAAELEHLDRTGQMRFTCPPQIVSALHEALLELEAEGPEARRRRYARSFDALRSGLEELGFEMLLEDAQQSRILLAVRAPEAPWYDFGAMHDALYSKGFTIYPGKGGKAPTFRLSVLGDIDVADIRAFLAELRSYLADTRA
jgi:2-aminoethylphosphonate-pyruvate transaminase